MGNYRFRLSNMMPNAWFYRLKDMGRASSRSHSIPNSKKRSQPHRKPIITTPPNPMSQPKQASYHSNRASYYFPSRERTEKPYNSPTHPKASDTHFPNDPPRKSNRRTKIRSIRPTVKLVSSSDSSGCDCRTALGSVCKSQSMPERPANDDLRHPAIPDNTEFDGVGSWSHSCDYRVISSATDIIVDMGNKSSFNRKLNVFQYFDGASELDLPPIITKPVKRVVSKAQQHGRYNNGDSFSEKKSPARRTRQGIHRIKIKESSPRITGKRIEAYQRSKTATKSKVAMKQRTGLAESFAIMKSSSDPRRDFRESMVEMIVENNIRASKDLEELLACYLSLNSDEYHEVIVNVFKEIWFHLTNVSF